MMAALPKLPLLLFSIMVSSPFLLSSQGLCTVTAAFLHFFFLASFCWVLTEAWQSYLAVIGKMRPRLIRKRFLCLGWGELARRLITSAKVGVGSVAGRIFSGLLYGEKRSTFCLHPLSVNLACFFSLLIICISVSSVSK